MPQAAIVTYQTLIHTGLFAPADPGSRARDRPLALLGLADWTIIAGFPEITTMKRTFQPSKVRRARTHGFLVRMKTRGGRAVINARRAKGRKRLAV